MLFHSQAYLLFFLAVFGLYWSLRSNNARVWLLLVASFFFYSVWNHWLALLIAVTSAGDYLLARIIDDSRSPTLRRALLTLSLVGNVGLLVTFKYANFFLASLEQSLHSLGASASMPTLQVILPIGISFYTFEAINYMVDVYRRRIPAERDLSHFMLFITFFPHLVAGPIVRAKDFLPQIKRPKRWSWNRVNLGLQLFLFGLFKKLVIADRMALFADPVFADPAAYRSTAVWYAVLAYALQIYCDFSGYTDMALGSAHLLGFKLAQNFNLPYLAANISDFWRRWHMSLSTWLRDYLFIPLGGSRHGAWLTCRNLLITMTLGGLWHGANWTFVLWGVAHGVLLILHRIFQAVTTGSAGIQRFLHSAAGRLFGIALTFGVVALAWVLFRCVRLSDALLVYERLFAFAPGLRLPIPLIGLLLTFAIVALAHLATVYRPSLRYAERLPAPLIGLAFCALLNVTLLLAPQSGQAFIYFQF